MTRFKPLFAAALLAASGLALAITPDERDLQTAMWVARVKYKFSDPQELIIKGIMTEEELGVYNDALDYLWRIRNELLYFNGRKNDQLTFDAQVHLAAFFNRLGGVFAKL